MEVGPRFLWFLLSKFVWPAIRILYIDPVMHLMRIEMTWWIDTALRIMLDSGCLLFGGVGLLDLLRWWLRW